MPFLRNLENAFLKFFGDIKVFKFPLFIIYEPQGYRVKGDEIRQVINLVQPGDILIRGYINYLDGYFIPGKFSHAGLYAGKITDEHRKHLSNRGEPFFKTGDQMVIHSMAEGVFMEDIIEFCRCDYMVILRFPERIKLPMPCPSESSTCEMSITEKAIMDRLANGEEITFSEIYREVLPVALSQVGKEYDFQFNFKNFNDLSCTEFVYCCYQCLKQFHNITPQDRRVLFMKKFLLIPDQFVESTALQVVWKNRFLREKK